MIGYDDVATWLGLPPSQVPGAPDPAVDDVNLIAATAAANAYVSGLPYVVDDLGLVDPAADAWPDDVRQGAVMYAARVYRRRNTPGGIDAFDGGGVYVPRNDSDVAVLLRLNRIRAR